MYALLASLYCEMCRYHSVFQDWEIHERNRTFHFPSTSLGRCFHGAPSLPCSPPNPTAYGALAPFLSNISAYSPLRYSSPSSSLSSSLTTRLACVKATIWFIWFSVSLLTQIVGRLPFLPRVISSLSFRAEMAVWFITIQGL